MINGINYISENILTNLKVINCDEINTKLISNNEINQLDGVTGNIQDQLNAIPSDYNLELIQDQLAKLNSTVTVNSRNINTNTSNISTNTTNISSNTNSINTLNSSVTKINNDISTIDSTLSNHTNSINSLNSSVNTINNTLSSHTNSINSLNSSVSSINNNISSINSTLSSHSNSISNLNTKVTEAISTEIADVAAIAITTGGLQTQITTINGGLAVINSNLTLLDENVTSLQNKTQNISSLTNETQTIINNKIVLTNNISNKIILDPLSDESYFANPITFDNNITQETGNFSTSQILGNNNILNIGNSDLTGEINIKSAIVNIDCFSFTINGVTCSINALISNGNSYYDQW